MSRTLQTTLEVIECSRCAISFAVPTRFEQERRRDHQTFYCPAGHGQHFPAKSTEERLRDQLNDAQTRLTHAHDERDWERRQRQTAERSLSATKGVLTRTRKRVAAGVCPCCKRTFQQLARHMAGQHPDFDPEAGA